MKVSHVCSTATSAASCSISYGTISTGSISDIIVLIAVMEPVVASAVILAEAIEVPIILLLKISQKYDWLQSLF